MRNFLLLLSFCLITRISHAQNLVAYNDAFEKTTPKTTEAKKVDKENISVLKTNQQEAVAFVKRAEKKIKSENYEQALLDYIAATDLDPTNLDALFDRGALKIVIGDLQGALADMTQVITTKPEDTDAFFNRATIKMNLNDAIGAIQDFDQVLLLDPEYTDAYYFRGLLKFDLQDKAGACADWAKAAKVDARAAKMLKKYRK